MKNIFSQLDQNLKEIYQKAVDADQRLFQLKTQGMGKFSSIFPEKTLFETNEKSFMPYVEELSHNIADFKEAPNEAALKLILQKMAELFKLLETFKQF